MDDAALAARQHASHRAFNERFATRIERIERPGGSVLAGITPESPERSLPNAVLYDDPADVLALLPELERLYARAGVRAWTVWVQPGDAELATALERAGHAFDGQPMRMAAAIGELDLPVRADLDVVPVTDWAVVGELNDRAYGVSGLAAAFARYRADATRGWLALADGRPAASVAVLERDGDAYVLFVATDPQARGRGLCSGLMGHALRAAAERGCTTTSLEGSPMGAPVYARLGYRSLGRFGLWERRVRNDTA